MKRSLRYRLEFCLFLCVIILSLFSFRFLVQSLEDKIISMRDGILSRLEEEYHIRVTYESLSPSIFRAISLRNIKVYDAVNNTEIAFAENFSIQYRLLALFTGKSSEIVRALVVENGFLRFDAALHKDIAEGLKALFPKAKKTEKKQKKNAVPFFSTELQPLDIHIKNIQVSVQDAVQRFFVTIADGLCVISSADISVSLNSSAAYQHVLYTGNRPAEMDFVIEGGVQRDVLSGYGTAHFSRVTAFGCGVHALQFFISYENDVFSIGTIQNVLSFDFNAGWNTRTNEIWAHFSCSDFVPAENIAFYNAPKNIRQFFPLAATGYGDLSYKNDHLTWNTDLTVSVPFFLFNSFAVSPSKLKCIAQGSDKKVSIDRLTVRGSGIDIDSSFSFSIDNLLPSGFLRVNTFRLPSGADISTYMTFRKDHGQFHCAIPSIKTGDAELSSIKIMLHPRNEKIDYSISAYDVLGQYSFDGSYLYGRSSPDASGFLELHGAFDSVSIGTLAGFVHAVLPKATLSPAVAESLQCTTEFYIFSDLQTVSYNCVRCVLVSNKMDDFYALVSAKGNDGSFEITDIDISYKKVNIRGNIGADYMSLNDIIFHSSFIVNNVGYALQGNFSENVLSLYGDYGLAVSALYDPETGLTGTVQTHAMPLPLLPLFFSCDSEFFCMSLTDWRFEIYDGSLNSAVSDSHSATAMNFYGTVNPTGVFLHNVHFGSSADDMLAGSIIVQAQPAETAYAGSVKLVSADKSEKLELKLFLSMEGSGYLDGTINLENLALRHFFPHQRKNHMVSAEGQFSGGKDTFKLAFSLSRLLASVKGKDLSVSSLLSLENGMITWSDTTASWGEHQVSAATGSFTPMQGTGTIAADYSGSFKMPQTDGSFVTNPLKTHISADFESTASKEDNRMEESRGLLLSTVFSAFSVNAVLTDWQLSQLSGTDAIPVTVIREKGVTAFYGGANDEVLGFKMDDGFLSVQLAKKLPVSCNANGLITKDVLDMNITDIQINLKDVWDMTGMDHVKFFDGTVNGTLAIGGKLTEPDFNGNLVGKNILVHSPRYIPEIFSAETLDIIAEGTMLEVPYTVLKGPSANIWGHCTADFFQWIPKEIIIECGTLDSKSGILTTDNLLFEANGYAGCNAEIIITPDEVSINGSASFDSGYLALKLNEMDKFNARYSKSKGVVFTLNLDLMLGKKAEFRWPTADFPILRSLVPTDEPLVVTADSRNEKFSVKGQVKMRGGEIFYIKRNFYIAEGGLLFLERGKDIEPLVSVRAEIRDRDEKGNPIRLILTAKEQPLMSFNPLLTSDPPRSGEEITQLLGGVLIGNTSKENFLENVLITGTDLLSHASFFKKSETKIRDFLHLDAFSFRTLLLQNAIFGNLFNANKNTAFTVSNYLDNTSVYIGKYFGSAIYADMLLNLSNYDSKLLKDSGENRPVYKNILFQPEIGLEMATPFFMLRWAVAPTQLNTMFVGDTSLTVSWKYSY